MKNLTDSALINFVIIILISMVVYLLIGKSNDNNGNIKVFYSGEMLDVNTEKCMILSGIINIPNNIMNDSKLNYKKIVNLIRDQEKDESDCFNNGELNLISLNRLN